MRIKIRQTFFFYICVILKLRIYSQGNFVFDSVSVQINALNINTKESEFGPFKVANKLYYTSSRERRIGVLNLEETTGHQMLDLYVGELRDSVTVSNPKPLKNSINNSLNQGSSFFDQENSKLYYSGNVRADYKGEKYKLAIFSSEWKDGKFLDPKIELLLPDTFLASHPMIYGKKLYFSSNLKGGKGKADLYCAEQVNGRWGNITNLKELNSAEDDYFPFVINEKEIYFSSNRPGGFGRLDLYKYSVTDGVARIQNLGKPINSPYDDFSAYVDANQESGYFTTTRNANQDDIYYFAKTWPTFNDCVEAIKETYCYDLTDEKALDTDSLKGYFYEWDFGDGAKEKGITVTHCYAQPGTYVVNLNIIDVSTKAVFLNQTAMDLEVDSIVQLKINTLDTLLVNKNVTINTVGTYLPNKKITGYYFELDNKRIRRESFEYTFTKTGRYRIKLGIEYDDLELNKKGTMCTNMDVHIVDSSAWLPFENRQLEEIISKFEARNIRSESSGLNDLNYDAELAYNGRLGLSRDKLADRIDAFLIEQDKNGQKKKGYDYARPTAPLNKNLNTDRNLLTELNEELDVTFRVHLAKSKEKIDTTIFTAKGLTGIKEEIIGGEFVYTYGNEAKGKDIEKYYKKALTAGFAEVEVYGYKNNSIKMDEYLAAQGGNVSFFGKNINGTRNLLTELNEDADITFRVHLGKSKTKMDTTVLTAKGIHGIKEEFIAGKYVYTYGNEAKAKDIDKYYKKALSAGLAEVDVFAYKDNAIKMDEYVAAQDGRDSFFGKNIRGTRNLLNELNEDADITFRVHLGKSKTKMDTTVLNAKGIYGIKEELIAGEYVYTYGNTAKAKDIDKYYKKALSAGLAEVDVFAYKNNSIKLKEYLAAQNAKNSFFAKNLSADRNGLADLSEDLDVTFRVHLGKSKSKMDTTVLNAKGIYGIKEELIGDEYVYTYGNASKISEIEKYYKKAIQAGIKPKVYAYKNNSIKLDEYLVSQSQDNSLQKGTNYQNLGVIKDTLLQLSEDAEINFRVYLGKSKTKRDTSWLSAMGVIGIKEELVNNEYVYTYGNEKNALGIEKFYRNAIKAGIKEPVILAYKNARIVPNQSTFWKEATFGDENILPDQIAQVKPKKQGGFFKRKRHEDEEITRSVIEAVASAEKAVAVENSARVKKELSSEMMKEEKVEKDSSFSREVEPDNGNASGPGDRNDPDPSKKGPDKKQEYKLPPALKPDDVRIEDVSSVEVVTKDNLTEFIEKYGNTSAKDLDFRVQISAFKYRNRYDFPHLEHLGKIESTLTDDGITRITIGGVFDTYKKANEYNKKVVEAGQKDAFVTVFYKGKRVYAENLEKMGIFLTK